MLASHKTGLIQRYRKSCVLVLSQLNRPANRSGVNKNQSIAKSLLKYFVTIQIFYTTMYFIFHPSIELLLCRLNPWKVGAQENFHKYKVYILVEKQENL